MTRGAVYAADDDLPVYARALRLRHVRPTGTQCFVLFEGMVVVGALLALAELVPWWGVFALPAAVAAMVKVNDWIAGTATRRAAPAYRGRRGARWSPFRSDGREVKCAVPGRPGGFAGRPGGMARHDRQSAQPRLPSGDLAASGGRDGGRVVRPVVGPVVGRASVPPALLVSPPGAARTGGRNPATSPADERTTFGLAHAANLSAVAEPVDSPRQRARQSAVRRYE